MVKYHSIKGQTALITGASSGIGKACAEQLASLGVHLILTARRLDQLEAIAQELNQKNGVTVLPFQLDVQKNELVEALFQELDEKNIEIDLLINNAGLAIGMDKIQDSTIDNWEKMIDTNIKGLLYLTRATLPKMIKRNRGYIVNIGSVAGHACYIGGNVYCATKYAVRAISQSLRLDILGSAIRVTEIDPGAVETEFSEVRWKDKERAKKVYDGFEPLIADDIADAVIYCVTRPSHVNIAELVIYPQSQASVHNIYRGT